MVNGHKLFGNKRFITYLNKILNQKLPYNGIINSESKNTNIDSNISYNEEEDNEIYNYINL